MSDKPLFAPLNERGVLEIGGADRVAFLQGLVSNDVAKVAPDRAIHAALLTAQGRYLFDFFILGLGEALYLDTEAARLPELKRRLTLYKLRAKITLSEATERFAVAVGFGAGAAQILDLPETAGAQIALAGGAAYVDPRLAALGVRFLLPREGGMAGLAQAGFVETDASAYDRLRLTLGVPDGTRDLPPEKALLLEAGFDELNGVDWQKGCYMGQELTARTKYRALIKKRLMPVTLDGPLPAPGTPILLDGAEAGEMQSGSDGHGLALLRLEAVAASMQTGHPLRAGETTLTPHKPDWAKF